MSSGNNKVEIEVSALVNGEKSVDSLGHSLDSTATQAKKLGTDAGASAGGIDKADNAAKGFTNTSVKLRDGMESISSQLATVKNELIAFVGIQSFASSIKSVAELADTWKNMQSRLQLALGAQADINKAMADVEDVAKSTYTSLDATANLYGKIASIGKDMGVSQQQALDITKTINQTLQLSGATAQASEAALVQLIQSLQSGVFRGDEFNSVMEQSPRLSKALADSLGVPIGALRAMAEQGKLTAQTVITAMQSQAATVDKEFSSLPVTIGRAVQNLQTEWQKFIGVMDTGSGASAAAAQSIQQISTHLDDIARLAAEAGAAITAAFVMQAVPALKAAYAEMVALGGATALLTKEVNTLNTATKAGVIFGAFEAGRAFGDWLLQHTTWAKKLGAVVFEIAGTIVNDLQLVEEAFVALFTKDTIGKALDRYKERAAMLAGVTKDIWADAEKAPEKVGAATDAASKKTEELSSAAQLAGYNVAHAATAGAAGVAGIGTAADDARTALANMAAEINAPKPPDNGITAITKDLIAALNRGQDLAALMRTEIPNAIGKLSGTELVKFRADFLAAMVAAETALKTAIDTNKPRAEIDALRAKVAELKKDTIVGLDLIAQQAAKNLGVDVPLAFGKMSAEFVKSDDNLAVLIRSMPALKAAGVDASAVVAQALAKMIDTAKSQEELKRVEERIKALGAAGQLAKPAVDALLDGAKQKSTELRDALDKVTPGINSLREAMAELGLKTTESLKDSANKAVQAYDIIKAKGQEEGESYVAWQARKSDAARVMLDRLIAANGGVASESIKTTAAMAGLDIQSQSTGKSIVDSMDSGSSAVSGLGRQVRQTTADVERLREKLTSDGLKTNRDGSAAGTFGSTIPLDQANRLLDATKTGKTLDMTQAEFDIAKKQATDAYDYMQAMNKNSPGTASTEFIQSAIALMNAANSAQVHITDKPASANPVNPGTQTPAKTYHVSINTSSGPIEADFSSDAQAQALIKLLQGAKLSSGL